jgi:hypothetical protein
MDTGDSSSAAIPSGNDIKDRNEKFVNAINQYISNLANDLGKTIPWKSSLRRLFASWNERCSIRQKNRLIAGGICHRFGEVTLDCQASGRKH